MRKGIDYKGVEWEEIELSNTSVDLSQQTFNKLTPQFPVRVQLNNRLHWLCECECGNAVVIRADGLRNGHAKSCGCWKKEQRDNQKNKTRENMIGKIFGELTVVSLDRTVVFPSGAIRDYYNCRCSCGNIHIVLESSLCSGLTKSCGCKRVEMIVMSNVKDLTGMRFGKLVVLERSSRANKKHTYWDCACDCGSMVSIRTDRLSSGDATSCGCESSSKGEYRIKTILDEHDVTYLKDKGYFRDLLGTNGSMLRYDFIIFSEDNEPIRLIEFDGPQHDEPVEWFGGEEHFQMMQYHDTLKNQYALSHNIPLVRIPYSKRDTITYDDLFGDKYLIKGEI